MIWSPSTTSPSASTARQRSASPSWAMPTSAPCASTALASGSRWVEPTPSLMLRPSGSAPMTVTVRRRRGTSRARRRLPRRARSRGRRAGRRGGAAASRAGGRRSGPRRRRTGGCGRRRRRWAAASARPSRASMRSSTSSGSLAPPRGEELDAVVGRRVVRCRDHDAEVGVDVGDQERGGRGRDDAGVEHVDARATRARPRRRRRGTRPRRAGRARRRRSGACPRRASSSAVRPWPRTTAAAWARPSARSAVRAAVGQPPDPVRAEERGMRSERADQRFENCGALRAFLRPAFLRSMTRASRVRKPAFFRVGAVVLASISFSERAMPRRSAPAWPEGPPPVIRAMTSYAADAGRAP